MSRGTITIPNRAFRHALIALNGLGRPGGNDLLPFPAARTGPAWAHGMVERLGFVQVDSIAAVERAHHHILFSRNHRYQRNDLRQLIEDDRRLFEHWTHDAAILPVSSFPYWRHYFLRQKRFEVHPGYRRYFEKAGTAVRRVVMRKIRAQGALRPRDVSTEKVYYEDPYFAAPTVAKIAAEYLWRTGLLGVTRRDGNEKVYDLMERVVPAEHLEVRVTRTQCVDWACRAALSRLGAGSASQIAHFFDLVSTPEAASWCARTRDVAEVRVEAADGAPGPVLHALEEGLPFLLDPPAPPVKLRLLNPFDPLTRDRRRAVRVFGFDYTIEIWVPAAKRKYGYYVLPILEGARFVGRADVKADRKAGTLDLLGLWWEKGVTPGARRREQLSRELERLSRFAGTERVTVSPGADLI